MCEGRASRPPSRAQPGVLTADDLILCYITDRTQFPGDDAARRIALLGKIAEAARCGVDYIQLREKDLSTHELETLARAAVETVCKHSQSRPKNGPQRPALLINARTHVAWAVGADGVHLRSSDISPSEVQRIWCGADAPARAVIGVSCHSSSEAARAATNGADFVVFGPVFGKQKGDDAPPPGLQMLHQACQHRVPVLALAGVTLENAASCLEAGAAGAAAIRLLQENEIAEVVRRLRNL